MSNTNFTAVSSKYNKTEGRTEETKIPKIREFNNWIKSSLISLLCPSNCNVLDICGGRGGDLYKYRYKHINDYVLFDYADVSITEAKKRVSEMDPKAKAKNYIIKVADCFVDDITKEIPDNLYFDFVSCQFAIHYAFGNMENLTRLFKNVTNRLNKGGLFVGTTVNDKELFKHLNQTEALEFGNNLYNVKFEKKKGFTNLGSKYYFNLVEAVPDIPEYLVRFKMLDKVANHYGLKLKYFKTFKECRDSQFMFIEENEFNKKVHDYIKKSLERIGEIPDNQWEVCSFYCIFVYEKV